MKPPTVVDLVVIFRLDLVATTRTRTAIRKKRTNVKPQWSVLVIYENADAQETAVTFCDSLVRKFWNDFDFEVNWWAFHLLDASNAAAEAAEKAGQANLIVLASCPDGDLPFGLKSNLEVWLRRRGTREGVLVGLGDPGGRANLKFSYLRNLAHRSGMDYLTELPQSLSRSIPDSLDSFDQRATAMTSVLDEILRQPKAPVPL